MTTTSRFLGRRHFLGGIAVGAGTASPLLTSTRASAAAVDEHLAIDVAIHSDTFRMVPAPGSAPPLAGFGTSFIVEGAIHPGGSLPHGPDIETASIERLGTWFCRGFFINTPERPDPHIISHQDFLFSEDLMVPHTIVTSGVEGNMDPDAVFYRAVTGGTGDFAGVTGQTIYRAIGTNTHLGGANLRFDFRLWRPHGADRPRGSSGEVGRP